VKGDALALNRMGGFSIAMGLFVVLGSSLAGEPLAALPGALMLGGTGVGEWWPTCCAYRAGRGSASSR